MFTIFIMRELVRAVCVFASSNFLAVQRKHFSGVYEVNMLRVRDTSVMGPSLMTPLEDERAIVLLLENKRVGLVAPFPTRRFYGCLGHVGSRVLRGSGGRGVWEFA